MRFHSRFNNYGFKEQMQMVFWYNTELVNFTKNKLIKNYNLDGNFTSFKNVKEFIRTEKS